AVVTSLDTTDHRDYYRTPERLTQTFTEFLAALPADGFAVLCTDHRHVRDLLSRVSARTITYGLTASARYSATLQGLAGRQTRCTIRRDGISLGPIVLNVPGRYNVLNALAARAVGLELGMNFAQVAPALESFRGVSRRFAVRGEVGGIMVVDDYAHNPIKVAAVLRAARESWPDRRIIAVFQPHRYTRTQTTYRRFATAFGDCDHLIITDIYPADEEPVSGVSAALIVDAVRLHRPVTFIAEQARVVKHLLPVLRSGDLVLTLGAGDIWKTAEELVTALKRQELRAVASWLFAERVPFAVLGQGSNVLISDQGIRGIVLKIGKGLDRITLDGDRITALAGAGLPHLARAAAGQGLAGLEFA